MNEPGRPAVPHPPYDELRAAVAGDPAGLAEVDGLHADLHADAPDPHAIRVRTDRLRGFRLIEARIANWFDDPATQRWIFTLGDAGL